MRDATTHNPIKTRTVVALEIFSSEPTIEKIVTTDDQGRFGFCAYYASGYALVALSSDGAGNYYAPAVDLEFTVPAQGIDLMIGGLPTAAPTQLVGSVSTDNTGVALKAYPLVPIGSDVSSRTGSVLIPLLSPAEGLLVMTTASGSCASPGCAAYQLIVPAQQPSVWTGTEWRRSAAPLLYSVEVDAAPCFPTRQFATPTPQSGLPYAYPGITLPMTPLTFNSCR